MPLDDEDCDPNRSQFRGRTEEQAEEKVDKQASYNRIYDYKISGIQFLGIHRT